MFRVRCFLGSRVEPPLHRGSGPRVDLEAVPTSGDFGGSALALGSRPPSRRGGRPGLALRGADHPGAGRDGLHGKEAHAVSSDARCSQQVRLEPPPLHPLCFLSLLLLAAPSGQAGCSDSQPPRLESAFVFPSGHGPGAVWLELMRRLLFKVPLGRRHRLSPLF